MCSSVIIGSHLLTAVRSHAGPDRLTRCSAPGLECAGMLGGRSSFSRLHCFVFVAFACGGIVVTHALAYLLSFPDAHQPELQQATTGGSLRPLLLHGLQLLAASILGIKAAASGRHRGREWGVGNLFVRLALVHLVLFVGIEGAELLNHSTEVQGAEAAFWSGVVIQLVTAALGALLFSGARTLVRALFGPSRGTTKRAPVFGSIGPMAIPPPRFFGSAHSRAPPAFSAL